MAPMSGSRLLLMFGEAAGLAVSTAGAAVATPGSAAWMKCFEEGWWSRWRRFRSARMSAAL